MQGYATLSDRFFRSDVCALHDVQAAGCRSEVSARAMKIFINSRQILSCTVYVQLQNDLINNFVSCVSV